MDIFALIFYVSLVHNFKEAATACTWPTAFQSSTWQDSSHGDLVFDTTTVTGFTYTIDDQIVREWTCVVADTFDTDGRLIFLSSSSVTLYDSQFYVYLCMTFTKITDASYRYYQNNAEDALTNHRIFIKNSNSVTSRETLCDDANGATGPEYQIVIRTGSEVTARVDCPYSFLGEYGYIHTDSSGTVTCDAANSSWETCTDNAMMKFDYTQCATRVAYSATDTVWCVDNVPSGDTNYVMAYNGGESEATIDNVSVYRYACVAISGDRTRASVTPQHCKAGQTATEVPTNNDGVRQGATLEMVITQNCSSCPTPTAPARGFVTVSTEGAVTKSAYTCETNYTLVGVSQRICQKNNTWTDTQPSCSCAPPPTPSNGARVVSTDGHQANYSCDVGFSLKGLQVRDCILTTAEWEDVDPECVQCASIETPVEGTSAFSSDGVTTQVSFTCDKSYSLAGTVTLKCLTDGSWDEVTPTCAKCPSLTNPISGSVTTSTDGIVTKANYTCALGYDMIGEQQLTCLATGSWDNNPPKCVCQSPVRPEHGTVAANGSMAIYTCELGYTISGVTLRTCKSDGTGWSETDPTCSLCVTVTQPVGGAVTLSTDGTITTARYTCERGYTISGSTELICQSDGRWSSDFSTCAQCQTLTAPTSGAVSIILSDTVTTAAIYSCFEGYDLNGALTRQCLADGSWEGNDPTCTCQSPPSITNGQMTSDGSTATYTCQLGYSLSGPQSRSCQTDGSGWTGIDPSCVECTSLADLTGGAMSRTTDGINTMVNYTCQLGYTLSGASAITCESDGTWNALQPTCVSCPSLSNPDSGSVVVTTDGYTSTAIFTCVTGYYISGASSLTCRTTGSWDNTPPTCKCSFPSTPNNGEVAVSDAAGVSVATYKCLNGFTLSGPSSRQCQTEGAGWQGSDPTCEVCESLSSPASGQFSYSTNGIMTKATFLCDTYTTMAGTNVLSCQTDGSWDNPIPSCVNCTTLSSPTSGLISVSTDGQTSTAFYSCVTGYSLSSSGYLSCESDGTWNLPPPSCICDAPPSPTNGVVTLSNNGLTATYSCNTGYELLGMAERSCLSDGTGWNGSHSICAEIPPTTTTTEQPSDIISVHVVVIILLALAIAVMMTLMIVFAVLYLKGKKTRIGSSSERLIEEPEKPNLMPDIQMPPSDTAKADRKKPNQLPPLKPKTRALRKPKKLIAKLQKRPALAIPPALEKSPTLVSASGIDVENLKNENKDKTMKDETKNLAKPVIPAPVLQEENEVNKKVQNSTKTPTAKNLPPLKTQPYLQDQQKNQANALSPNLGSLSSMEIPIFDDVQPINADVLPIADVTNNETLQPEVPKKASASNDKIEQNNDATKTTSIDPASVQPTRRPATGIVIKRKRNRPGYRNTSFKDDVRETRPKTPIEKRMRELGIDRIMTPDLLEQVAFNYIHPVIVHDAPSSARGGRPSTGMSSRTFASYT